MTKTKKTTQAVTPKKTKAELRVLVAKDAKKQINLGKYTASHIYFSPKLDTTPYSGKNTKKAFCDLISKGCQVCGIGAIFASQVRKFNNFTIPYSYIDGDSLRSKLKELFTTKQINLIENAFETNSDEYYCEADENPSLKQREAAHEFGEQHWNNKDRMLAILDNIIENKGTFKP